MGALEKDGDHINQMKEVTADGHRLSGDDAIGSQDMLERFVFLFGNEDE